MKRHHTLRLIALAFPICSLSYILQAQSNFKLKYNNSTVEAGIEVGAKGVKLSVLEIGKNAKTSGAFNILKDSSINTDFISFSDPTFQATLNGLFNLYSAATRDYHIPSEHVFTVVSSGVKVQAEKDSKMSWVTRLIDSFRVRTNEPSRAVAIVDVADEARLSHLGIVPESKRYTTFLIDIGSGNSKGGYFPNGDTKYFKLFQLTWGTKSTTNAVDKRCGDDKSIVNFNRQLPRVLSGIENDEIIYAVNSSGAYPINDIIAFSGGIAWSVATLLRPDLIESSIVPVTFDEVAQFSERLYKDSASLTANALVKTLTDNKMDKTAAAKEINRVHAVFDQRSLMGGTGLLLKVMRQFEGIYEKKQFYLVKNGQVGWISAYVDQFAPR